MGAKKQQTFAKLQRERRVRERRELKQEKKQARKLEEAQALESPAAGLPGTSDGGESPFQEATPEV
jgi:hypothetical protein